MIEGYIEDPHWFQAAALIALSKRPGQRGTLAEIHEGIDSFSVDDIAWANQVAERLRAEEENE